MAFLPELTVLSQTPLMTSAFLGINKADTINDGEMADCRNLTADRYPLLSPRKKRSVVRHMVNPTGMIGKGVLCTCENNKLYVGEYEVTGITLSNTEKTMVSMGAYLCVFPDKVYVNTSDITDKGHMDATFTRAVGGTAVTLAPCRINGTDYDISSSNISDTAPSNPSNGDFWIDTSSDTHVLKQYSNGEWTQVATTYVKISSTNLGKAYGEYDTVTISGIHYTPSQQTAIQQKIQEQAEAFNGSMIVYASGDDYILVAGFIDQQVTVDNVQVKIQRKVPDLDFVCECNNRLWGCFYGMRDGVALNEIYACKLGDFKNWNTFMGLSTDSYTVSVGTDGKFTGCATLKGNPLFFKEGCVHKISGSVPSGFMMNTTMCRGIQEGSEKSAVVVGEYLYYKSRTGVMQYDGSTPTAISASLGTEVYHNAVAGAIGNKYYISMKDSNNKYSMFVWYADRGLWLREDDTDAICFTAHEDSLYCIDRSTGNLIDLTGTATGTVEDTFVWDATFGVFGYEYQDQKYLSRFNIRMQLMDKTTVRMYIQYDSDGVWHDEGMMRGKGTQTFMVPVIPRRCDHCQIRLTGTGDAKVFSIARIYEDGSDG